MTVISMEALKKVKLSIRQDILISLCFVLAILAVYGQVAHHNLGLALGAQGKHDEAHYHFVEASKTDDKLKKARQR